MPDNLNDKLIGLWDFFNKDQFISSIDAQEIYPCCSNIHTNIIGAINPKSVEQIQSLVIWANNEKVVLYPISTGNNWGYGGGHPSAENALIVCLSQMNNIISFDSEIGIIDIEAGVSQGQTYEFLKKRNEKYYTPVTGSSPTSSLIGNALDRGYGVTPITDHFSAIMELTVVLPDGTLETYKEKEIKGLFGQSNLGIIVSAKIELSPHTQSNSIIIMGVDDIKSIENITNISRDFLIKDCNIVSSVKFFNLHYLIALNANFPNNEYSSPDFSIEKWIESEKIKQSSPMWLGILFLNGPKKQLNQAQKLYKEILTPFTTQFMIFTEFRVHLLNYINNILQLIPFSFLNNIRNKIESIIATFELIHGIPQNRFLKAAYWRTGNFSYDNKNLNPAKDGAGLIWFSPILPFRGKDLINFNKIISTVCIKYKFFPVVSMSTISSRSLSALVPILFDPKTEKDDAFKCYNELFKECKKAGYIPYRGHVNHLTNYTNPEESIYWQTIQSIKKELDENSIMSIGRYDGIYKDSKNNYGEIQ